MLKTISTIITLFQCGEPLALLLYPVNINKTNGLSPECLSRCGTQELSGLKALAVYQTLEDKNRCLV